MHASWPINTLCYNFTKSRSPMWCRLLSATGSMEYKLSWPIVRICYNFVKSRSPCNRQWWRLLSLISGLNQAMPSTVRSRSVPPLDVQTLKHACSHSRIIFDQSRRIVSVIFDQSRHKFTIALLTTAHSVSTRAASARLPCVVR